MPGNIDFSQASLWISAASILFNPTFWNIAARQEYHNKTITKLFNGNSLYGCYALAVTIFTLGIIRDYIYHNALSHQPSSPVLEAFPLTTPIAYLLLAIGNTLVLSSMWALGVTGTYLGDYFGILMDDMVTGFPFNVTSAPMYHGSACSFLGTALYYRKPAGVLLTAVVLGCYSLALSFEDPFTAMIYRKREEREQKQRQEGKKEL